MSAALSWEYTGARELCVEVFTSHSGNIGAKIMTKLTTALATSVALIAIASIADAKGAITAATIIRKVQLPTS
jgi:hypothetical protein